MKRVCGSQRRSNECSGNYHSWLEVSQEDLAAHPGAVAEPVGSFHYAACYVAREIRADGRILDVRIGANPAQQYWDCTYDQDMLVPTMGGHIEIELLGSWHKVFVKGPAEWRVNQDLNRSVWRALWRACRKHAKTTEELLDYVRKHVAKNSEVLGLAEDDDLRVD